MEDATIEGIAQTIQDRDDGDYAEVLAWMKETDIPKLLDGFDLDIIEWYFSGLEAEAVQDYPRYAEEIGPAIDRVSDAFDARTA